MTFTDVLWPLIGGVLIGLSASGMLLSIGRVTGISGIFGGVLFRRERREFTWRALFLAGLLLGGLVLTLSGQFVFEVGIRRSLGAVALGGLLVGFGTTVGNGCTSGHGVCGVSRFSRRSLIATCTFIGSGVFVAYVVEHVIGGF